MIDLLTSYISAILAHECGHIAMALALGIRIKGLEISRRGIGVRREAGTPWQNALIAAAGPALNLILFALFWKSTFGWLNLAFGVVNLMPFSGADGPKIVTAIRELLAGDVAVLGRE